MSTAQVYDFNAAKQLRSNRMENQKHGYIPLYRSVKKQPWAKDVFLRTLWENLLIDAARQPYTANYKGQRWPLEIGQLVTTSADLGLSLCDRNGEPTSRHAVERMLAFFVKEEMISVVAERRKGTLITILNYAEYAEKIASTPAHNAAHMPEHSGASDTKASGATPAHIPEHKGAHHEQEYKNNNNKNTTSENSNESSDRRSKRLPVFRPEAGIQNGNKWGTHEDLRAAEWLFSQVRLIAPSAKEPNYATWANDIRLMREKDNRDHREMCSLFKWACQDSFWKGNVLCPATLREKWDQLSIKRNKQIATNTLPSEPTRHWNDQKEWENNFL